MILAITITIVFVVFAATRFGFKAESKAVRILSYLGIFISIALIVYLLVVRLTEKFADNLPIF